MNLESQTSRLEEIIGCLWLISSILLFTSGHPVWGIVLLTKAVFDFICSICIAIMEMNADKSPVIHRDI